MLLIKLMFLLSHALNVFSSGSEAVVYPATNSSKANKKYKHFLVVHELLNAFTFNITKYLLDA